MKQKKSSWGRAVLFALLAVVLAAGLSGCTNRRQKSGSPNVSTVQLFSAMKQKGYTEQQVRDFLNNGYTPEIILRMSGTAGEQRGGR